ncbi:MAG: LytTR family DNA-binding domain-containing protein [Rikenellaceae bacterium]
MRCIAIDDEPIALSIISSYCQSYPHVELSTYTNPVEGMAAVGLENPDVVFLDIEMNDYSGLELARELPKNSILIFTTAHASYALNGYEVNAVDFLHKPFSLERFDAALSRASQIMEVRKRAKSAEPHEDSMITIKVDYQNVTIPTSSITYIEAMDNYIKINTSDKRPLLTKMSIKYLMELLPANDFLRIHRSFIVAKTQITSYTKQSVRLREERTLPVGRSYGEELFKGMATIVK